VLKKSKSEAAFKQNLRTELQSGKMPIQALAIAFSVKRKAKKSK
jgi:hypothetical protein